jgi:hypothetical protein
MNNDIEDGEVLETGEVPPKVDFNYQRMKRPREDLKAKRGRCKYWPGSCHRAQDCPYLHEGHFREDYGNHGKYHQPEFVKPELLFHYDRRMPCKYFHGTGVCTLGDSCKFSHARLNLNTIPRFIRDNEAFLQELQETQGYTNLGDHYLNYLRNKIQPLLPSPSHFPHIWIPQPPPPDISSRLQASGIIKNRSITVPKVDPCKLKRYPTRS